MTQKTHHIDYLDVDPDVRGQRYFCVSFVEPPKDRFAHKESFIMGKFTEQYSQILYLQFCKHHDLKPSPDFVWDTSELYERYMDFKTVEYDKLCKDYEAKEGDATHMRLFKVRGTYREYDDAVSRCKVLQKLYPNDQISVSEVGKWGPYAPPNFNDIKDIVYTEEKMQQFMKENLENDDMKMHVEQERKRTMMTEVKNDHQKNQPVVLPDKDIDDNSSVVELDSGLDLDLDSETHQHLGGELGLESVPSVSGGSYKVGTDVTQTQTTGGGGTNSSKGGVYTSFPYM